MVHTIQSDILSVGVDNAGAELASIYSKKTGIEYLWQGDPAIWPSRAPILFPIVGGLKDGGYMYDGKSYKLNKHGFARPAWFYKAEQSGDRLVFEYVDNPQTRLTYPFAFTFRIIFSLRDGTLDIIYQVVNEGEGEMLFSTGSHEGFRCPRNADETFEDYFIEFDRAGTYNSYTVSDRGLMTNNFYAAIENDNRLPLKHSLFANDALIFTNIESKKLFIKSKKSPQIIEVTYDAPHLGIWTKVGAPYVCIEPWCGLPDYEDSDGLLIHKDSIIKLAPGGVYEFKHAISIVEP